MVARRLSDKSFDELRLMPIEEAASRYFCSRRKIEMAIADGMIVSYKPGRNRLIDLDSADEWFMTSATKVRVRRGSPRKR